MGLNLIIGRSKSGKSEFMYKCVEQAEISGKQVVILVPDFARIVAEEEYLKYFSKDCVLGTKITTLSRFISQNIDKAKLYQDKQFLPDLSRKFVIKKCIDENPEMFNIFKKVKNTPGFVDKVDNLFKIFENEELTIDTLDEVYPESDFLKAKLAELLGICGQIHEYTNARFIDSTDEISYFIEAVLNKETIPDNAEFFFDGYNNFTRKEYGVILSLLRRGITVNITLDLDLNRDSDIFDISYDTYSKLKMYAKLEGVQLDEKVINKTLEKIPEDLKYLQRNIFNNVVDKYEKNVNNVTINVYSNPMEEVQAIAQDIILKVQSGKYRYKDICVLYNNPDVYDIVFTRVIGKYNIPMYVGQKINIQSNRLTCFLVNVLQATLNNMLGTSNSMEYVIQILKCNLLDIDFKDVCIFENYINEFGIKFFNLKSELTKNNIEDSYDYVYDLEKINQIRMQIYDMLADLKNKLSKIKSTKKITQVIYDFLNDMTIISRFEKKLSELNNKDKDLYDKNIQTLQEIYKIMDSICIAYEELSLKEYVEFLLYAVANTEVSSIPSYVDQIQIADINHSKVVDKKCAYIIGLYENGLPIVYGSDSIFQDKEVLKLETKNIEITKSSETRNQMALFNIYKAINTPTEELHFSLPSTKQNGETLSLSPVISQIKDVLDIQIKGNISSNHDESTDINIEDKYTTFIKKLSNVNEDMLPKLYTDYILLSSKQKYKTIFEYLRVQDALSEDIVQKLYKDEINSSVSRLEQYKKCPFSFYSNYILGLSEKKKYALTRMDMGTIMHDVLEKISVYILAQNIDFADIMTNEKVAIKVKNELDSIIDTIFANTYLKYNDSAKYRMLKNSLKKSMFKIVKTISQSFVQSSFRPIGFEVKFEKGELFAPIEVELNDGKKMYLRGKIDRIDAAKIGEKTYLRIVDYKSTEHNLKLADVKEGVSLQLMTYMWALINNKSKISSNDLVFPAALSYFTLNTKVLGMASFDNDQKYAERIIRAMKLKGIYISDIEVLKKMDFSFESDKESYIDVTTRMLSNVKSKQKVLDEETFSNECANMSNILSEIGNELVSGSVKACGKEDACKYCKYSDFCRRNMFN